MKIYDISQELFGSVVFPGDPVPEKTRVSSMEEGAACNVTKLTMCAHNGTHLDAPFHFCLDGKTVEQLELSRCVGQAKVVSVPAVVDGGLMRKILRESGTERLLLKGECTLTPEAAREAVSHGLLLLGVEKQSVAPEEDPVTIHRILLEKEVLALEGIRLAHVEDGEYFLCAQPVNLGGCDGAPVRALLLEM